MPDNVIRVENLGKKYILGHQQGEGYTALRDVITNKVKSLGSLIQNPKSKIQNSQEEFWALKDVSFEIKQGDRVGIIGRNGAGKSTLLKILSRITEPTRGQIQIKGRVASLLEVGTGFHQELTGRENVFLNGAILGMSKVEIKRKFDEIIAFAEIEKFLDTPVKRYSSGMYVRLAFAVAAHLEPEILIVDEVLAVGDLKFQKKCLGKMENVANEGRTVLFVSHNAAAIRRLCSHGILLEKGIVKSQGDITSVLQTYIEDNDGVKSTYELPFSIDKNMPGYAYKLTIEDEHGNPIASVPPGKIWQVRINFIIEKAVEHFVIDFGFMTSDEVLLKKSWSQPYSLQAGEYQAVFREETLMLNMGRYSLVVGLTEKLKLFQYVASAGTLEIAEYNEEIDLVAFPEAGSLLNPTNIQIENSSGRIMSSREIIEIS